MKDLFNKLNEIIDWCNKSDETFKYIAERLGEIEAEIYDEFPEKSPDIDEKLRKIIRYPERLYTDDEIIELIKKVCGINQKTP